MFLTLNPNQTNVFAALFDWRDQTAREYDESHGYVLPKHALIKVIYIDIFIFEFKYC